MNIVKLIAELRALACVATVGPFSSGPGSDGGYVHGPSQGGMMQIVARTPNVTDARFMAAAVNAIIPAAQGGGGLLELLEYLQTGEKTLIKEPK